nr:hypothetical protein [Tanacetum cinerariifolium]
MSYQFPLVFSLAALHIKHELVEDLTLQYNKLAGEHCCNFGKAKEDNGQIDSKVNHVIEQCTVCSHLQSISSDSDGPSWGIPLMNVDKLSEMDPYKEVAQQRHVPPLSPASVPDPMELDEHVPVYVSEPKQPKYHAPSDDDIQVEDQPLADDASLTAESPGYIADSDSMGEDNDEDPEEDPSEEHEPEDDDEDPEEDPNEEPEPEEEDTKEEELSEDSDETEPFKEDETAITPPPPRHRGARISAPLCHRTAMIRRKDDILKEDMPPQRRFVFTAPPHGCDVAKSFVTAAARAPRGQYDFVDNVKAGQGLIRSPGHDDQTIARAADRVEDVGYVRALHASEYRMMTSIEEFGYRDIRLKIDVVRGQRTAYETEPLERQSAEDLAVTQMMRIHALEARARTDTVEDADSSCAALTWWNGHVRTLGHDAAYAMTWGTLKKKLTEKYCPKGKIKKLEIELWNHRVKGNDVAAYTQCFQELALMCTKFLSNETEKVDKYISGLPDNIHENFMTARPKTLDETIELANDLMDKKLRTYAERQNDNKRKADDSSRNNQQQQPHKKQNVARAYTAGPGEKKAYTRNLPLCTKCNYHHTRVQSTGTCFECEEPGNFKKNCPKLKNNGNANGNGRAQRKSYVLGGGDSNPKTNTVTGTFLFNNRYALILFDTGADRSFVSIAFSALLNITPTALENHYDVELADGKIIGVNTILRGCTLEFLYHPFNIDLMPVPLGCDVFLAHVTTKEAKDKLEGKRLEDVPIIRDFPEVFPEDLSGIPPARQVEFQIDLVPGAAPVAWAIYRLAPAEMKELADQLQELSEKGFIRPNSSP